MVDRVKFSVDTTHHLCFYTVKSSKPSFDQLIIISLVISYLMLRKTAEGNNCGPITIIRQSVDKSAPFSSAHTKTTFFFHFSSEIILGRPRGGQSGREKRCNGSFQAQAEKPLGTDSHRTVSKRSSECWFLIGHKKCFVLLCTIDEQFLLRSFREFVHDGYFLFTVARFVHQAFLTRNEESTDESKTFRMLSAGANSVSDGSQCIVNNRKFKMKRRRESKKSNSLTRQNNKFARASRLLYISLPSLRDYLVKMPNFTFYEGRKQAMTKFSFPLYELGYGW